MTSPDGEYRFLSLDDLNEIWLYLIRFPFFFIFKIHHTKININPIKEMQTLTLIFNAISMDDAECAEWNEKRNKKVFRFLFFELSWKIYPKLTILRTKIVLHFFFFFWILMFHDIIFIFIIIHFFFWTKKGNGPKLDENRLDEYRSWTKVNWTNPGLDKNRVGRKQVGRKWIAWPPTTPIERGLRLGFRTVRRKKTKKET